MRSWSPERIAQAAGARLVAAPAAKAGPERVIIDSREAGPGSLFVGLPGAATDGGRFADEALGAGAWGVLVAEAYAREPRDEGVVIAAADPLRSLQRIATAWRRELGAYVIGVTGSTGKTTTKDILHAVLAPQRRTVASRANFNTEVGLPLEILAAPFGTEVLVLEMAMRGRGQIAELARIAEPDVGVIVSVGPVHLELLGTVEAIAAAKAELLEGLPAGGCAIVPAGEGLLEPHLRSDVRTVTFGAGGDVRLADADGDRVEIDLAGRTVALEVSFPQSHLRRNLLAAVAAADAIGVLPRAPSS
jgi:UDP-N-acetylmuramoyl-tripeptide--D-alanyl-D-alanine ligase